MRVPSSSSFPFTKVPSSDLVLFVETDVSRTVLHKKHLLAKGYRIFQAKNCVEAFNIIDKAAVKVIVLDLNLKDNQAFEFLQGLKKKGTAASVIAITSRTSSKAALQAIRLGARNFLLSPFTPDKLSEAIGEALKTELDAQSSHPSCVRDSVGRAAGLSHSSDTAVHYDRQERCRKKVKGGTARHAPGSKVLGEGHDNLCQESDIASSRLLPPLDIERQIQSKVDTRTGQKFEDKAADSRSEDRKEQIKTGFGGFIGTSASMQQLYREIESAARSEAPVFITGESGTGKEVCAEAVHKHSPRAGGPFIAVNCAAIPRDLLESELFGHEKGAFTGAIRQRDGAVSRAHSGSLFLDEIGDMDLVLQTKLLRFLQNFTFNTVGGNKTLHADIRVICATNKEPRLQIRRKEFREDLFYRLYVLPLHMPPLRERGDDITDLAHVFLRRYSQEEGRSFRHFSEQAEAIILTHTWPGNIRELQNVVRHIVVMRDAEIVTTSMLPDYIRRSYSPIPTGSTQAHKYPTHLPFPEERRGNESTSHSTSASPAGAQGLAVRGEAVGSDSESRLDLYALAGHTEHIGQGNNPEIALPKQGRRVKPLWMVEKETIERTLGLCGGNVPKAAALLEVSPSTIYRKQAKWQKE